MEPPLRRFGGFLLPTTLVGRTTSHPGVSRPSLARFPSRETGCFDRASSRLARNALSATPVPCPRAQASPQTGHRSESPAMSPTTAIPSARGTSYSVAQSKRSRRSHPKASGAGRRGSTGDVSTGTSVQVEGRQGPIHSMTSRLPPGQPAPPRAVRPRRPRARRCGATTAPAAFRVRRRSSHGRRQTRMSMTTLPASPRTAWAGRVSAHHRRQGMGHRRHLRHGRRRL